ncbi:MAG: exodeoxyribonuclease VII large subunit [Chloroflexi bacterium]|jgi:exodeoxyribonuclease VII large subunit|nr:exodeoxyribonuclease VII large subunit [Chloroflexota bacterium]|tara:strand:- start:5780 stop:6979 length:1200 start_codon:yes stop_codon:yes gene_type:complete
MKNIFEVSSLLANLNNLIDQNIYLKDIWIQGEVTDYKGPAYSGHKYFSIKDENSLIKCVFFKFAHIGSDDFLDGDKILINGEIEIYSPAGNLQLKVRSVKKHGLGDISIEIERLRQRLEQEGLFDTHRKREIPLFPQTICVITSENSSAWEDIKKVITMRYPLVNLILIPTLMQGENCIEDVCNSIDIANKESLGDIILLSRGGGSEEDLMPFNSEEIVRYIFSSKIPVVTGIGHEDDNTLSDYVADTRGLTPTGAAQIITPDINDLRNEISSFSLNMQKAFKYNLEFKFPEIEKVKIKLQNIYPRKIEVLIRNIDQLEFNLNGKLSDYVNTKINKLEYLKHSISIFNITEMSKKGYALVENQKKRIIKSVNQVEKGEKLKILLSDGILNSKVENKIKE